MKSIGQKVTGFAGISASPHPPTQVKVSSSLVPFLTYENTRWEDPEHRAAMQKLTLTWGEAVPVLGWYDPMFYGSRYLVPRIFPHAEQEVADLGAEHQVKYYYAEAMPNWGEGANLWVLTKLLWNPRQDVEALLDDWYRTAVGTAAAPKLKEYYQIWEKFLGERYSRLTLVQFAQSLAGFRQHHLLVSGARGIS